MRCKATAPGPDVTAPGYERSPMGIVERLPTTYLRHRGGWDVMVTTRRFQHHIEVVLDQSLEHYGLTYAQYRVLELIANARPIHVSEMARRLRLSRQAVQTSVHGLEDLGAVDLERDGVLINVFLSDPGRQHLRHYRAAVKDTTASIEAALDLTDRNALITLMKAADEALEPAPAPPWWLAP
jgi:DNA-binding MarR family transcriptional regulator